MSKPILALNSIRGKSGKDTLIEHLEKQLGLKVFRVAFADVLKKQCAEALGDPRFEAHMHTSAKDTENVALSIEKLPEGDYKEFPGVSHRPLPKLSPLPSVAPTALRDRVPP